MKPEADVPRAVEILISHGVPKADVLNAMSLTKSAIADLTRGRADDAKALRIAVKAAISDAPATRFEWRKDK